MTIEPLYVIRPEVDTLSIEDIKRKIKVLQFSVRRSRLLRLGGHCQNRLNRLDVLDSYLQIKNGIDSIL